MIDRRSLLSWMGTSVAGALYSRPGKAAHPSKSAGVIALESFHVTHAEQMPRVHRYLGEALLPLLNEILHRPGICLEAVIAPQSPQALVLTAYSSFDEMLATRGRIAAHLPIQITRAELESSGLLTEVRSQVLIGTQEALRFPAASEHLNAKIFELRSYHCPTWHAGPPSLVTEVLDRAGIHPIVSASFAAGEHIPQFTYQFGRTPGSVVALGSGPGLERHRAGIRQERVRSEGHCEIHL